MCVGLNETAINLNVSSFEAETCQASKQFHPFPRSLNRRIGAVIASRRKVWIMKTDKLLVLAILLVCSSLGSSQISPDQAAVPPYIKFSGVTVVTGGKVGITGITFALYKQQHGGAPLWIETQNVQVNSTGHYTAQLGITKRDGLAKELFTSGEARWLGVRIEGQAEQPRVLLLSVPYALKAADAETLGGLPPSAFLLGRSSTLTTPSDSRGWVRWR